MKLALKVVMSTHQCLSLLQHLNSRVSKLLLQFLMVLIDHQVMVPVFLEFKAF
jgi:hypothetical protein